MRIVNATIPSRYLYLILFLWLLTATNIHAQDENRRLTISGQLIDADLEEPMIQATIQLFTASDSVFVGGTVSDVGGNFIVQAPSSGTYKMRISSIGYQTIEREITLRRNENQDVNSYALLHVRYRLNMFGGKIDTQGRYDKKWGNRDQRQRQWRR